MRTSLSPLLGIILLLLVLAPRVYAAPPAPTADARARVLVLSRVEFPATVIGGGAKLAAALTAAVTQRGYEVATAEPTTCLDNDCLRALATKAKATDVLVVRGGATELFGYAIDLRLWSATTDRDQRASSQCNACTATQMIDILTPAVGSLLDRIPALNAAPAAITTPPPTSPPPPQLVSRPPPPAPPPKLSPGRVALGAGMVAGGGVALGFGISMLASNGDKTTCLSSGVCTETEQGSGLGTALTVGGGILAAVGVVGLLFFRDEASSTSIALGPAGISVGGTY